MVDPGVSKSTLLVAVAAAMSRHVPVLYVHLLVCEDLVQLDKQVKRLRPTVLIIDSL